MNPLISVIVPVYNLENYISRCVDGIIEQSYKNWELILVDDGSADNSASVCLSYAEKDSRIKVICKENRGVAEARNTGVAEAKGEYITFIDGDDFVARDYIEYLYRMISENDCDIAYCGFVYAYDDGHTEKVFADDGKITVTDSRTALIKTLYRTISASACCKLYKRSVFGSVKFEKYSLGEDAYFIYRALLKVNKVVFSNAPKYNYYCRKDSAVHIKTDYYRYYDFVKLIDETEKIIPLNDGELKSAFAVRFIENYFFAYIRLRKCDKNCEKEIYHIKENLKRYRKSVILNPNAEKRTRIACLISFMGMNTVDFIYDITEKLIKKDSFNHSDN